MLCFEWMKFTFDIFSITDVVALLGLLATVKKQRNQRLLSWLQHPVYPRAGLRGGQRRQLPRAPRCKGASRDEIYLFQIKYSFEKFLWFGTDTRIQLYIILLCCVKYQGLQQQLISLQVGLFSSFSHRYWRAYKYFRFCSMQMYFILLVTFS